MQNSTSAALLVEKPVYSRDCEILDCSRSSFGTNSLIAPNEGTSPLVPAFLSHPQKERDMDREHVKGAADKAKGTIKETAGKVTGDKELESEGKVDKAKGDLHNAAGNVKDAARDLSNK
jgi:uncharacterized protein YjbJ (UPF0337 family)